MKQHILITGSSGMLGIDLCQELKYDYHVAGMDLVRHPKSAVKIFYKCDICDRGAVESAIGRARPDIVIHCAAWTDVDGCELDGSKAYRINSEGTKNVATACRKYGAKLIYISTDFVFDGMKISPYKETDRPRPLSVYGDSKLRGEGFVKEILKEYFILRTSWLYGRYGKNFVDTIAAKGKAGSSLRVVMDQTGSPTYTKYLAKAMHRLLDRITAGCGPKAVGYGIYHVSDTGRISWYGYAREILRLCKSKVKVLPITSKELARPAKRPKMSVMDNSKLTGLTGYRMPGWKEALKEYLSN